MTRLVCVVADKNIEAAVSALLESRRPALGLPDFCLKKIVVHPGRDPGCYHKGADFLRGLMGTDDCRGLLVFDQDWQGNPHATAVDTETAVQEHFARLGIAGRAEVVVIEPEIEAWVWSSSPHVGQVLGWDGNHATLRNWLSEQGLWPDDAPKPPDPKAAVEAVLSKQRIPRSSALYRKLAQKVSLKGCQDAAFLRFRELLRRQLAENNPDTPVPYGPGITGGSPGQDRG